MWSQTESKIWGLYFNSDDKFQMIQDRNWKSYFLTLVTVCFWFCLFFSSGRWNTVPWWELPSLFCEFFLVAAKQSHCSAIAGTQEAMGHFSSPWKRCLWLKRSPAGIKSDGAWRTRSILCLCSRAVTKWSHDSTESGSKCRKTKLYFLRHLVA